MTISRAEFNRAMGGLSNARSRRSNLLSDQAELNNVLLRLRQISSFIPPIIQDFGSRSEISPANWRGQVKSRYQSNYLASVNRSHNDYQRQVARAINEIESALNQINNQLLTVQGDIARLENLVRGGWHE